MKFLGNLTEDQVIDFHFSTHAADGTPTTLAGTPVVSVYKANATNTETTTGVTLDVDFDSVTGLNHVRIDTSADAFYAVANDYSVVITTGTVDSVSVVGTVLATFSIENRFNEADAVKIAGQTVTAAAPITVGAYVGTTYAIQQDASGYTKISDGTGTGQINLNAGAVPVYGTVTANVSYINGVKVGTSNLDMIVFGNWVGTLTAAPVVNGSGYVTYSNTAPPTAAEIKTAIEAAGSHLALILEDTGTTLPATLTTITGYVDCLPATWVIPAAAGDAMALTSAERNSLADVVLGRSVATCETTAAEWSLCTVILATLESSVSGTTWTIKRSDGSTTHATKAVATDSTADPITGVS